MATASEGFINSLHGFDPLLSVRWGDHIGRWVIERKAYISETEIWFLSRRTERFRVRANKEPNKPQFKTELNEICEELIAAKNGKRVVLMPKELAQQCFNLLALMDTQRWGGYSRMADALDEKDASKEKDLDRQLANERESLNKRTYDILDFLWRKRSSELASGEYRRKNLKQLIGTSSL